MKVAFQSYHNISLVKENVLNAEGHTNDANRYILKCLAPSNPEDAFLVCVLENAQAHKWIFFGHPKPANKHVQLKYKHPYEFSVDYYGSIMASPTIPGVYHKSFLCMQYKEDKFKTFSTQFQLSSAESKESLVLEGDKVYLQILRPGQSANDKPELRGSASKVLEHAVGVEEYTNILRLPKIKFTMEYVRKP